MRLAANVFEHCSRESEQRIAIAMKVPILIPCQLAGHLSLHARFHATLGFIQVACLYRGAIRQFVIHVVQYCVANKLKFVNRPQYD